jgi:cell division protein FtsN
MQKSEKFFIFSWKEILVLGLVALTAIGFFFTLGLHYGKRMNVPIPESGPAVSKLESGPDSIPPKETLEQGTHHVEGAAAEAIREATHDEMEAAGLKVEHPKPVDLPKEKAAAKDGHAAVSHEVPAAVSNESEGVSAAGRFALQLGSYPSSKDAQKRISQFLKRGIKTEMRTALVHSETRYRVVIPGFQSLKQAERKGKELQDARKVETFVVIKAE